MEICLSTVSVEAHTAMNPSSCWWNSGLWRIGRHICQTWTCWSSLSDVLQAKGQTTPHANLDTLHPLIAVEWDRLAEEYICKTCYSFCRHQEAAVAKTAPSLNR